jgi:hypothetical protein
MQWAYIGIQISVCLTFFFVFFFNLS